jgi:hypothetical protein
MPAKPPVFGLAAIPLLSKGRAVPTLARRLARVSR